MGSNNHPKLKDVGLKASNESIDLMTFPVGSLGCNCSILYSKQTKEAIVIDPGNDAEYVLSQLKNLQLRPSMLLHTHAHFDHIGESDLIRQKTQARMYLHQGDQILYENLPMQGMFFGFSLKKGKPIDSYLQDGETFGLDAVKKHFLQTLYTPGHTHGSCCFYTESLKLPVLFSGDTLFENSIGRTDLPGGNFDTIKKSIKDRLYSLPEDTILIPGHGETTTIYREKRENPFVR